MHSGFETLGNATLVFYENDRPVLATDPWLEGRCYAGSWALERSVTPEELKSVLDSDYIWISHGHPDHFHMSSLKLLRPGQKILLPDHYAPDIRNFLTKQGFAVEVLQYRAWKVLSPTVRCLCLDNENQDSILIVEVGGSLMVNLNDSPLCGDERFIRSLVRRYPREKTYMAALCSNDADMMNFVDENGRRTLDVPEARKPGMVWERGRIARKLGVGSYVCSASQHIYARPDSLWANPYRVGWSDVVAHWHEPDIRIIEPFVIVDSVTGGYDRKEPSQTGYYRQAEPDQNGDDWDERLDESDWKTLSSYFQEIELLRPHIDYVGFKIGGESRKIWINPGAASRPASRLRGIEFEAPKRSLIKSVSHGYFDDLLIGNFMRTHLKNATLYPHFTPIVAKLRGSARVKTFAQWRQFRLRYFRRNPIGYLEWRAEQLAEQLIDRLRKIAESLGVKGPLKRVYRRLLGDPAT